MKRGTEIDGFLGVFRTDQGFSGQPAVPCIDLPVRTRRAVHGCAGRGASQARLCGDYAPALFTIETRPSSRDGFVSRAARRPTASVARARGSSIANGAPVRPRSELSNVSWLLTETVLRLGIAAAVDVAIARYLSPDGFGALRFSVATVTLFTGFVSFGFAGLATRDLIRHPEDRDEILGTVVCLRLLGTFVAAPLAVLTVWLVRPADGDIFLITAILAVSSLFQAFSAIDFYFQSELRARHAATARLTALVLASAVKLALVVAGAPLIAFGAAFALEFILTSYAFLVAYGSLGLSPKRWRFGAGRARGMVLLIWPAILGGAANTMNLRIDQVMVGSLDSAREVGVYAVAVRLSEVWYLVPAAICASAFPALVRAREENPEYYRRRLQELYSLLAWMGIILAVGATLFGGWMIRTLFGRAYDGATPMLAIHIWAGPFVFMGTLFSNWLIAESRFGVSAIRHGLGALINVSLNLLLIPHFGGVGAAWATLVSYAAAQYLACFTYRPTFETGAMMTRALLIGPAELLRAAHRRGFGNPPRSDREVMR